MDRFKIQDFTLLLRWRALGQVFTDGGGRFCHQAVPGDFVGVPFVVRIELWVSQFDAGVPVRCTKVRISGSDGASQSAEFDRGAVRCVRFLPGRFHHQVRPGHVVIVPNVLTLPGSAIRVTRATLWVSRLFVRFQLSA